MRGWGLTGTSRGKNRCTARSNGKNANMAGALKTSKRVVRGGVRRWSMQDHEGSEIWNDVIGFRW